MRKFKFDLFDLDKLGQIEKSYDILCSPIKEATVVAKFTNFLWEVYLLRLHHILPGFWI
jgi:hypothetical protein